MEWNPLFEGAYGLQNVGDDAFCTIAAWGARCYWKARQVRYSATTIPLMPESIAPLAPHAIFAGKPLFRGYFHSLSTLIYRSIYSAQSSGIVYAGGSTFWHVPLARRLLRRIAQLLKKPLAAIGVSIGPFRSPEDRQRITDFLQQFSFLTVRDQASYEEARTMTLPYAPVRAFDLAALLPAVYCPVNWPGSRGKMPTLGVALCHYERYHPSLGLTTETSREDRLKQTLLLLVQRRNIKIRFHIFNGHSYFGDMELAQELAAALAPLCPVEFVPYTPDPAKMWRQVATCDAFLAQRLHSAIFAYAAGVPFVLEEYHRKCANFAEDIGLPEAYRFPSAGPDPVVAAEVLADLLDAPRFPELSPQEALARAELNFTAAPWYRQPF